MKVTYNWLKEFVDISLSPQELADRLTMAGLEVESAERKGDDTVFTIEVTSNRPDWLSIRGIAREVAAITGKNLKQPAAGAKKTRRAAKGASARAIEIENSEDCRLYTAKIIEGVAVGPSPDWMRRRLELVGVRPVNNIVDITNYTLFELGEPLHAFDLDKLSAGPVIVRRARGGERMIAIDGREYSLGPDVLVIADSRRPVAIAGVMGGKDAEVTSTTKNILLESAIFDPVLVRRGRQKLGIQSESSYRFERGIDPHLPPAASARAAVLIEEISGGVIRGERSRGQESEKTRTISLDTARTCGILGVTIGASHLKRMLSLLGFRVSGKGRKLGVAVPSFRRDVKVSADLVEEIARMYGYDNFPSALPPFFMTPAEKPSLIPEAKEVLRAQGLDEVLTYSLIDRKFAEDFYRGSRIAEISNPLSSEQGILRPVLMPSLARCAAYNLNQRQPNVAVFEIAKTYAAPDKENLVLGIALSGTFSRWFGPGVGNIQFSADFLCLKGIIDTLCTRLGIDAAQISYEYSDGSLVSVRAAGKEAGVLKKLSDKELGLFDIKDKQLFLAEISLDTILPLAKREKVFSSFSRFPSISRDITLELCANIPVGKVLASACARGGGLMKEACFRDYYDRNLPSGVKRITITCIYSAPDRTLTEAEVSPVHAQVINSLQQEFSAQIR